MLLENQQLLSRRERQIMDVLIGRAQATAQEVLDGISDPPSYSAVRATLRIMEEKGYIRHEQQGARYVYLPVIAPDQARRSALRHVVDTFFQGSPEQAMAALLDGSTAKLSKKELKRMADMIESARKEGR